MGNMGRQNGTKKAHWTIWTHIHTIINNRHNSIALLWSLVMMRSGVQFSLAAPVIPNNIANSSFYQSAHYGRI